MAFSAATVFALGADEIVMHPHGSLGPIDPQITIALPDGQKRGFSFEDVGAFLRFLLDEVGITEQAHLTPILEQLFDVVDPVHIGGAKRASELSTEVGERLLQMHMQEPEEKASARRIAEDLNKSFFAHSDAVSRTRARELQLRVADDDDELEGLLWRAFLSIEKYLRLRQPFNPLHHYLADPNGAASVSPSGPLKLPPNAPPQLVQQLWNQAVQQAQAALGSPGTEVPYEVIPAIIESVRLGSEFRVSGTISATRVGAGEIQVSVVDRSGEWRRMEPPDVEHGAPDEPVPEDAGEGELDSEPASP